MLLIIFLTSVPANRMLQFYVLHTSLPDFDWAEAVPIVMQSFYLPVNVPLYHKV